MTATTPQVYEPGSNPNLPASRNGAPTGETAGMVLAAQAKALVEARYLIAMKQPRDIDAVRARLLRECQRPSFAEVAIYHKPVGDGIEGPSIRFAEAAIQAMSNLLIETPTIYDDHEKRIVRVSVADMESNVAYSKDVTILKRVERRKTKEGDVVLKQRTNSRGQPIYIIEATDDEILNTENALVSKALRTIGLRLVPGWLIEECLQVVRATRKRSDAADPDAARRKLYDAFGAIGVSVDALKQWLGHDGSPQPKELEELRGIYTAIKDGDTTWRDVLDARWAKTIDDMGARAAAVTDGAQASPSAPPPTKGAAGVKAALRPTTSQAPAAPPSSPPPAAAEPRAAETREPGSDAGDAAPAPAGERKAPDATAPRQAGFRPSQRRGTDEFDFDR